MIMTENNNIENLSSEQRKTLYRELLDEVELLHIKDDENIDPAHTISDIFKRCNTLYAKNKDQKSEKHTDEVLLDAKVVATATDALLSYTRLIDFSFDSYDPDDLAKRICDKFNIIVDFDDEDKDLTIFNQIADGIKCFPKFIPNYYSLYEGINNIVEKPVKEAKSKEEKKRTEQVETKRPEKLLNFDKKEDSVDDTVKFLQWALNKTWEENDETPINFYRFIISPNDFTVTIEHLFYFSFLIRDGRAKFDLVVPLYLKHLNKILGIPEHVIIRHTIWLPDENILDLTYALNFKHKIHLSRERREMWIKVIKRIDLNDNKLKYQWTHSKYFLKDENDSLTVIPMGSHDIKKARKHSQFKQFIVSMDMTEWQEIINTYHITSDYLQYWKKKWDAMKKKSN